MAIKLLQIFLDQEGEFVSKHGKTLVILGDILVFHGCQNKKKIFFSLFPTPTPTTFKPYVLMISYFDTTYPYLIPIQQKNNYPN